MTKQYTDEQIGEIIEANGALAASFVLPVSTEERRVLRLRAVLSWIAARFCEEVQVMAPDAEPQWQADELEYHAGQVARARRTAVEICGESDRLTALVERGAKARAAREIARRAREVSGQ